MLYYVHSSLIYNSQKLERTQMSLIRGIDTNIVVYLQKPEAGKNPDVPQQRNGYRKYGSFTQYNTSQQLKTMNS